MRTTITCRAVLSDLDGTLIQSLAAVDRAWNTWSRMNGFDPAKILPHIHGRRSLDSIRLLAPQLDAEEQDLVLRGIESRDTDGVTVIEGSLAFLQSLPPGRWAIVTSGTRDVATARLRATGLPIPTVMVCGDDVSQGKPAPDPFLLAAELLGIPAYECLVLEDTLAGIRSGVDAGMKVLGVAMTGNPPESNEVEGWVLDHQASRVQYDGDTIKLSVELHTTGV